MPFRGFALPTSNTTYTPNQFFDVCLPHCSRGAVRLVAYMIRKTLGWCDAEGKPQAERFSVSYSELESRAGISRDMIHSALNEAIAGHFIRCVRTPEVKRLGASGHSGVYELRWDERNEYVKDPTRFRGFFAGEGNRTYIPNQFFDDLAPRESLGVLKVVGSVIRFSIGFQNKWGHRRRNVALSYQHVQNYSRLRDRKTVSQAIQHALAHNYIERVEVGYFDPNAGRLSKPAVYAVKWLNEAPGNADEIIGRKTPPMEIHGLRRSENPTGIGQKTRPADRSENPTDIEIKQSNNTYKQHDQDPETAAVSIEALMREGFDAKTANAIAAKHPAQRVLRQIDWIDLRTIKSNRLGMLREAIEHDWGKPIAKLFRADDSERSTNAASIGELLATRSHGSRNPQQSHMP
jgi:hypothetical protein